MPVNSGNFVKSQTGRLTRTGINFQSHFRRKRLWSNLPAAILPMQLIHRITCYGLRYAEFIWITCNEVRSLYYTPQIKGTAKQTASTATALKICTLKIFINRWFIRLITGNFARRENRWCIIFLILFNNKDLSLVWRPRFVRFHIWRGIPRSDRMHLFT